MVRVVKMSIKTVIFAVRVTPDVLGAVLMLTVNEYSSSPDPEGFWTEAQDASEVAVQDGMFVLYVAAICPPRACVEWESGGGS
jgi:hypothetical protein